MCSYVFRLRIPDGHTDILRGLEGVRAKTSRGWSGICAWVNANDCQPVIATDLGPVGNVAGEMVDLRCLAGQSCREKHRSVQGFSMTCRPANALQPGLWGHQLWIRWTANSAPPTSNPASETGSNGSLYSSSSQNAH